MIRKQVYLTEEQPPDIKLKAKQEQKPQAEVIRVSTGLHQAAPRRESTGDSLLHLAAIDGKGPADLSSRIDDYLYGDK